MNPKTIFDLRNGPPRRRRLILIVGAAAIVAVALLGVLRAQQRSLHVASAQAQTDRAVAARGVCDRFASPRGRDRAPGTARRPVRSVQRLVHVLHRGQAGCLRAGVYVGDVTVSRSQITLRNQPGQRARVEGRLWFTRQSHDSEVRGLTLDGRNRRDLPSPTVNGTGIRFVHNNITNEQTGTCFILGSEGWGRAQGTVIRDNRIHGCGRLPPGNYDHGIYVAMADRTTIVGNWIYDNADRGIQLYPDAHGTRIERNVIDGNGEGIIFSGDYGTVSTGNVVRNNVIANSRVRADVESFWPEGTPPDQSNIVQRNCIGGRGIRGIDGRGGGFDASRNIRARPRYADRAHGNLRVVGLRPCVALLR